jgi:hypothetical protein
MTKNGDRDISMDVNRILRKGVFSPNKISGVGTNFGLLVHCLSGAE